MASGISGQWHWRTGWACSGRTSCGTVERGITRALLGSVSCADWLGWSLCPVAVADWLGLQWEDQLGDFRESLVD